MKLPHPIIIAEPIAPPPADEVDAIPLHARQQFPAAISGARELLLLLRFGECGGAAVARGISRDGIGFGDLRDAAEVGLAI